ncbi:MAG: hypothetical protein JW892_16345 [Anaerolineae bacterium]|nr:hypothetical protein [Anaerolineae bacterium]
MAEMGGPVYDYGNEGQEPRRREGRGLGGFVIGLLLGLGAGFWAGRGAGTPALDMGALSQEIPWALAALIPLVILVMVAVRFRERTVGELSDQARSVKFVLIGLIFTVGVILAVFAMQAR